MSQYGWGGGREEGEQRWRRRREGEGRRRLRLALLAFSVFTAECFMAAEASRVVAWAKEGSTGLPMDCQVLARRCLV